MTDQELIQLVSKLRRDFPRHQAILGLCAHAEGLVMVTKPKGRPLDKDLPYSFERTRPWEAEGMSRRTWYRRRRAMTS